jgi:putative addiction module component (TIGR02574 family)
MLSMLYGALLTRFPLKYYGAMSFPSAISDLSLSEKLQLVEDLWDDIASDPEALPIHDWQKEELTRRKRNLSSHPESAISWADIEQRVVDSDNSIRNL